MRVYIGDRSYSSWSFRGWLAVAETAIIEADGSRVIDRDDLERGGAAPRG
ncbi:MAG: hypothetical protein ACYC9Z_03585 [Casimicrobiaceae bacterium]